MKYAKRILLTTVLLVIGWTIWWCGMNYTGYCHAEGRYLSDEEKIDLAIKNILQTYPPVLTENAVGVIHAKRPDNPIYYSNIQEFKTINKKCCEIVQEANDGEGYRVSVYSKMTGSISGLVHIKYLVKFKEKQVKELYKSLDVYPAVSNCGRVWSGI